ncbi:TPA: IS5/IS1182 family transposase, partial [Yersinia enterocolitica]|nr:IS5/IS1182 family transposase [Yersinia enterocolitica]
RFRGLMKVQMQCLLAAAAQNMKKIALLALFYCLLMIYRVQNRGVGYEKMLMALLKHLTDGQEKNIANATFGR